MLDQRREARLAQEALAEALVPGKLRREHLERHLSLEAGVVGPVHDPHSSPAQQRLEPVAGDLAADTGIRITTHTKTTALHLSTYVAMWPCFYVSFSILLKSTHKISNTKDKFHTTTPSGSDQPIVTKPKAVAKISDDVEQLLAFYDSSQH